MESFLGLVGAGLLAGCFTLLGVIPFGVAAVFAGVNAFRPSAESKRWGLVSAIVATLFGGAVIALQLTGAEGPAALETLLIGAVYGFVGLGGSLLAVVARPKDGPRAF